MTSLLKVPGFSRSCGEELFHCKALVSVRAVCAVCSCVILHRFIKLRPPVLLGGFAFSCVSICVSPRGSQADPHKPFWTCALQKAHLNSNQKLSDTC